MCLESLQEKILTQHNRHLNRNPTKWKMNLGSGECIVLPGLGIARYATKAERPGLRASQEIPKELSFPV